MSCLSFHNVFLCKHKLMLQLLRRSLQATYRHDRHHAMYTSPPYPFFGTAFASTLPIIVMYIRRCNITLYHFRSGKNGIYMSAVWSKHRSLLDKRWQVVCTTPYCWLKLPLCTCMLVKFSEKARTTIRLLVE